MSRVTLYTPEGPWSADLDRPIDISIPLRFDGPQPEFFGAPRATARPLEVGDWVGDTRRGAGCNVNVHVLTPHCNGTHTECMGHITDDGVHVAEVHRGGLARATLITVEPADATATAETTDPAPRPGDRLITATAIRRALAPDRPRGWADALILRHAPNPESKATTAHCADTHTPYLSLEAASLVVELDVRHLLVDVPSLDGMHDDGRLSAHHVFWGLPPGSRRRADATRAHCTVTEMIYVPDAVEDGRYVLDIMIPPFMADAAPSRPILFEVL